jgi:hypothetical protein
VVRGYSGYRTILGIGLLNFKQYIRIVLTTYGAKRMKKLLIAALILFASWDVFANGIQPIEIATPYCLQTAPTVNAGTFINNGFVNPTSNAATTMEFLGTDVITGIQSYFVVTITAGTGYANALISCPVQYATKH